jgi:hypothetical protein
MDDKKWKMVEVEELIKEIYYTEAPRKCVIKFLRDIGYLPSKELEERWEKEHGCLQGSK